MNVQTQEALKELVDLFYVGTIRFTDDRVMKALAKAKEALAQPAQEPVACPYPCGWNNLYSIIVKKGAYLAKSTIGEDEIFTSNQRNEMVKIIDYAKTLCEWGKNTHPAPAWQGLSDDEINNLHHKWIMNSGNKDTQYDFARAIEQALKEKNHERP